MMSTKTVDPSVDAVRVHIATTRELEQTFDALVGLLITLPATLILQLVVSWVARLAGIEAETLAARVDASGNTRSARHMMNADNLTSRREKAKKAKRAKAASANPELARKMKSGQLSADQMDNIAHAANKDPAAATDNDLIGKIAEANPDQGRRIAQQWLNDRQSTDDVNKEHQRQRSLRAARKGFDPLKGVPTITLEGDKASIDQMWSSLMGAAGRLYQTDGGRDIPQAKHPRSLVQRLFDCAHQVLTGSSYSADSPRRAGPQDPAGRPCTTPARERRGGAGRPAAVVSVPIERLVDPGSQTPFSIAGQGPIADDVAQRLLQNCDFYVQITKNIACVDQPLWLGRTKRHATVGQYIALAARDRGCVMCTAPPERCHAHHLVPWHAPQKGTTDISGMALLCPSCHTRLHEQNLTLAHEPRRGVWITRAATPGETPPARPPSTASPPS